MRMSNCTAGKITIFSSLVLELFIGLSITDQSFLFLYKSEPKIPLNGIKGTDFSVA